MRRSVWILSAAAVAVAFVAGTLYGRGTGSGGGTGGRKVLYYVDPMHPSYRSDRAGIAPDCGMQLEPVYADGSAGSSGPAPALGTVKVEPAMRQAVGVRVAELRRRDGEASVRLPGRVAADETRVYRVTAAVDGWVRDAGTKTPGARVRKDEILSTYYAPEFVSAIQAYLFALGSLDRYQASGRETQTQIDLTNANIQTYRTTLHNLGMSDVQVADIARSRKLEQSIWFVSPADGILLARNVSTSERFDRGREVYRVADLSRVWVLADVRGDEARLLRPGAAARVSVPGRYVAAEGRVADVLPQYDAASRSTRVRLVVPNPALALLPDMPVDVEVSARFRGALAVPADAVVDTGRRRTVYVEKEPGVYVPRAVKTGERYGEEVEILEGLSEGDRIVVSGTFLVDSESRMKMAAAGVYGEAAVDPVCSMDVDEGKAKGAGRFLDHGGTRYWFCSAGCMDSFRAAPGRYMKGGGAPAPKAAPGAAPGPSRRKGGEGRVAAAAGKGPARDPVCGMEVDEAAARAKGWTTVHGGKGYFFCNPMCKASFDGSPDRYLGGGKGPPPADPRKGGKAVDPVCGMEVDEAAARERGWTSVHGGKSHFFCNPMCKASFDRDPERFVAPETGKGGGAAGAGAAPR